MVPHRVFEGSSYRHWSRYYGSVLPRGRDLFSWFPGLGCHYMTDIRYIRHLPIILVIKSARIGGQ